jgi:AcrR family transcriptional regulator
MNPKERILSIATYLFYKQGYTNTGINQIIKESKTAKASFYEYFPSKENLGKAVLRKFCADTLFWMRGILRKSKSPEAFSKNLSIAIKKQIQSKDEYYIGCPVALFSAQISLENKEFQKQFNRFVSLWESILSSYLLDFQKAKKLGSKVNIQMATKNILNQYEGALLLWRLSGNKEYIHIMELEINRILNI